MRRRSDDMTTAEAIRISTRNVLLLTLIIVQVLFFPGVIMAQEVPASDPAAATDSATAPSAETVAAPASPPPANPEPPANTGPTEPPGASRPAYQFNEATGLWESDQYTWDPNTHQTTPKTSQDYSYNPATGMWDTTEMRYDPVSGTYVQMLCLCNKHLRVMLGWFTNRPGQPKQHKLIKQFHWLLQRFL